MKSMLRHILLVLVVMSFAFALPTLAAEEPNPVYQEWSSFKPGSFVTYMMTTETAGVKTETELTYTLKEVTAEKIVLEVKTITNTMGMKIETPAEDVEFPATGESGGVMGEDMGPHVSEVVAEGTVIEEGVEEEVEINGKKIMAMRTKVETESAGSKAIVTAWHSDEIPGQIVRSLTEVQEMVAVTTEMVVIDYNIVK